MSDSESSELLEDTQSKDYQNKYSTYRDSKNKKIF